MKLSSHVFTAVAVLGLLGIASLAGCGKNPDPIPAKPAVGQASPPPPKPTTGWIAPRNPGAKVALVFVHGIFGDAHATWTAAAGPSMFEYLQRNEEFGKKVDLFAFGYPSRMINAGSFDIVDAANALTDRLAFDKVTDYPTIVFVAHSMGGLVVIQQLLNQQNAMMPRVPLVVLYATPTEGSQIATIGKYVFNNPGLANMTPANGNTLLKKLHDDWVAVDLKRRPHVRCAFEKQPMAGVMIVEWTSANSLCSEAPASPIDADHSNIVKPDRPDHGSLIVLVNALRTYAIGKDEDNKLATPDFNPAAPVAEFRLTDPYEKSEARLVNPSRFPIKYTIKAVSDPKVLLVWPGDTPREVASHDTTRIQFYAPYATAAEYSLILQTDSPWGTNELPIVVKIPDFDTFAQKRLKTFKELAERVAKRLEAIPPAERNNDSNSGERVALATVQEYLRSKKYSADDASAWVLSADIFATMQMPNVARTALLRAEAISPGAVKGDAVGALGAQLAAELKQPSIFATRITPPLNADDLDLRLQRSVDWLADQPTSAKRLADELQRHPKLAADGIKLNERVGPALKFNKDPIKADRKLEIVSQQDDAKKPFQKEKAADMFRLKEQVIQK